MEKELFFTGYCRQFDRSRMVCTVIQDGSVAECDCCYGSCVYQPECPIAQQIAQAELSTT